MGDEGDFWRDVKAARAALKAPCPKCIELLPRAQPSQLLPQQRCRIHGYRDPRPYTANPTAPKGTAP